MSSKGAAQPGLSGSRNKSASLALALGALGVVFGDIGTSPLYAGTQLFLRTDALRKDDNTVLGGVSLILWALTFVVAIKYVLIVLRADHHGEGGVFALLARLAKHKTKSVGVVSVLLVFAAGLLFGDGVITPAISVLSAVEGLNVVTPLFSAWVIPITVVILIGLFAVQSRGTAKIGALFGPIMIAWFGALALLGAREIGHSPKILRAVNPKYAYSAASEVGFEKLALVLGAVMLVITGGEALFADLGHFGAKPIRTSWFALVFPALILNYLGQGAYILSGSEIKEGNLFFSMVPNWALAPMVVLATFATVIASQALITGAFSLATQGMALGLIPRSRVVHTHEDHAGQIYVPLINWSLLVGCIALVVTFKTSENLASAYGLAVSAVMLVTTIAVMVVATREWNWKSFAAIGVFGPFAIVDFSFLMSNMLKFLAGGWVPALIGATLAATMFTWRWGRKRVTESFALHSTMLMRDVLAQKRESEPWPKSIILLTPQYVEGMYEKAPPLLEIFLARFHALPGHMILLTVAQDKDPYVSQHERYRISEFENDRVRDTSFLSIEARFGYMEDPDIEQVITDIAADERLTPGDDLHNWLIHAGKDRVIGDDSQGLFAKLRFILFKMLSRNAEPAYSYFGLDDDARLTIEMVPVRLEHDHSKTPLPLAETF